MGRPKGSKNKPKIEIEEDHIYKEQEFIKKKRGRPPKQTIIEIKENTPVIKKRGRPSKKQTIPIENENIEPKKRGRPPKLKQEEIHEEIIQNINENKIIKKKRGRPTKPKPIKRKYKFIKEVHGCGYYEAPKVICKYEDGRTIMEYNFHSNVTRLTNHKENSIIKIKGIAYTFLRYDESEEDLIYILEDRDNE